MKLEQGNMLTALVSARRFLAENETVLFSVITPPARQKLDETIADLSQTAAAQDQFTRDTKGSIAAREASRKTLIRNHMTPIAKVAKLELATLPELVKLSLPKKRVSVQQLATLADGMADAARPHAQVFIDAGRAPDFLDQLKAAANLLRADASDGVQGRVNVKKATTGLTEKLSRARKVVHMFDAYVKEAVGNDQALLDSWRIAKRVRKTASRPATAATTDASTPAAATTTTTTTTAAAA